jgi:hypothetical protein
VFMCDASASRRKPLTAPSYAVRKNVNIKYITLNQNASKTGSRQVGTAATTVLPTVRRSDIGEE